MSQVGDIESLKQLAQALLAFARRQTEVQEDAKREILKTRRILDEAEDYWRRQIQMRGYQLNDCLHAHAVARHRGYQGGYFPNCQFLSALLHEAQGELRRVQAQKNRLGDVVSAYRQRVNSFSQFLENRLPKGRGFLGRQITALEAYEATRLIITAAHVMQSNHAAWHSLAVNVMKHHSAQINGLMGELGEQIGAQILSERFGLQEVAFDQPKHGIDRVFSAPGIPLIIVESKTSSDGTLRLSQTSKGEQVSADWIAEKANQMSQPSSAQWSPANQRIASLLKEIGSENVPVLAIVTNPVSQLVDVYVRQKNQTWALLEGGIELDSLLA